MLPTVRALSHLSEDQGVHSDSPLCTMGREASLSSERSSQSVYSRACSGKVCGAQLLVADTKGGMPNLLVVSLFGIWRPQLYWWGPASASTTRTVATADGHCNPY
jgi:hypothetical protein